MFRFSKIFGFESELKGWQKHFESRGIKTEIKYIERHRSKNSSDNWTEDTEARTKGFALFREGEEAITEHDAATPTSGEILCRECGRQNQPPHIYFCSDDCMTTYRLKKHFEIVGVPWDECYPKACPTCKQYVKEGK